MRLWHYKLIPYLPDKWLIDQWRSLIAIKRNWEKNGDKMNIPLVNYIKDHPIDTFHYYTHLVMCEMVKRKIKIKDELYNELMAFNPHNTKLLRVPCIYPEHDLEYFKICYYNLLEKYNCGIIQKDFDWRPIRKLMLNELNGRRVY